MTTEPTRSRVLCSIQRAMLGEVFPGLRAITIEWRSDRIEFCAYVDGPASEEDLESLSCISAEVAADFGSDVEIDYDVVRRDAPEPIHDSRTWVFRRREVC